MLFPAPAFSSRPAAHYPPVLARATGSRLGGSRRPDRSRPQAGRQRHQPRTSLLLYIWCGRSEAEEVRLFCFPTAQSHFLSVLGVHRQKRAEFLERYRSLRLTDCYVVHGGIGRLKGTWAPFEKVQNLVEEMDDDPSAWQFNELVANVRVSPFSLMSNETLTWPALFVVPLRTSRRTLLNPGRSSATLPLPTSIPASPSLLHPPVVREVVLQVPVKVQKSQPIDLVGRTPCPPSRPCPTTMGQTLTAPVRT